MGIDYSAKSTRTTAIALYKRMTELNSHFQMLVLGTGQGKTAIAVATAGLFAVKLKRDINVFVIAPRSKLDEGSWAWTIDEYNKIAKYKLNLIDESTPQGLMVAKKNDYLRKKDIKAMPPKRQDNLKFIKKWYEQVSQTPTIFLIDEAHNFKNPASKQTKALQKLIRSSIAIGLSATPMPNGLLQDGVAYLVLNQMYNSKSAFYDQHVPPGMYDKFYRPDVFTTDGDIDPNRFYNLDQFHKEVEDTIFAPQVEVDFELPNTRISNIRYDLTADTIQKLKNCHKDYRERRYDSYMQYLSELRELIGSDLNHARTLAKLLMTKPKQPLILYYTNAEFDRIVFTLEKMGWSYKKLNGHSDSDTMADIDKNDVNQAIVIQYKSGGSGIEFPQSNMTIFYGLQYSWGDTEQALGRNVRRGMSSDITVDHVFTIATNPHDAKVFEALQKKKKFTEKFKEELAEDINNDSLK